MLLWHLSTSHPVDEVLKHYVVSSLIDPTFTLTRNAIVQSHLEHPHYQLQLARVNYLPGGSGQPMAKYPWVLSVVTVAHTCILVMKRLLVALNLNFIWPTRDVLCNVSWQLKTTVLFTLVCSSCRCQVN